MTQKNRKALYAGTFDPFTLGHLEIVHRALRIFEEVTVLVAVPAQKVPVISVPARVAMIKELFLGNHQIKVDAWSELTAQYAREHDIGTLIRGLRPTGDFESEFQQASMNNKLYTEIDTVFFMTRGEHYFISSSMIREVLSYGGDISPYVPEVIYKHLMKLDLKPLRKKG